MTLKTMDKDLATVYIAQHNILKREREVSQHNVMEVGI